MKQPLVSVIVPTKNCAEFLDACLRSIAAQTYKNIELIVVDNNSSDDTKVIARRFTNHVFNHGPERSAQRNYGARKSKAEYLLFIDSDMELTPEVVRSAVQEIKKPGVKGVIIPEESFGEGFWAHCKALERSFYVGIDWMEAARFFPKEAFETVGGYDEDNTGTEDYDLPHRIQINGGENCISRIDSYINHNERRLSLISTCKKKYYYTKKIDQYSAKPENHNHYVLQASLLGRYRLFLSNPKKLFAKPFVGLGMLFMKTAEFVSGGLGKLS